MIRRHWRRVRLAYDLLLDYEREEREGLPVSEALRRIAAVPDSREHLDRCGTSAWRDAVLKKVERY